MDTHKIYLLTLPGKLKSPDAISITSMTQRSGAWTLLLTPNPAVTPSYFAFSTDMMSSNATRTFKSACSQLSDITKSEITSARDQMLMALLKELGIKTSDEKNISTAGSLYQYTHYLPPSGTRRKKAFWHWAVFVRDNSGEYVLESKTH